MLIHDMNLDISTLSCSVVTKRAFERPLPCVYPNVSFEVTGLLECGPTTEGTLVHLGLAAPSAVVPGSDALLA